MARQGGKASKAQLILISFMASLASSAGAAYLLYTYHPELLQAWQGLALAGAPLAAWLVFLVLSPLAGGGGDMEAASEPAGTGGDREDRREQAGETSEVQRVDEGTAPVVDESLLEQALEDGKQIAVVQLLGLLQREGRLLDFLQEEIEPYDDAQIGAAVREVHRGCRAALKDLLGLAPVLDAPEGSEVEVDEDFDPMKIRLTGNIQGDPPFKGVVRHCGWRFTKLNLPEWTAGEKSDVLAPAEVEVR